MTVISNSIEALAPRDELSPAQTLKLIEQMAGADKPALSTAIGFKEWANVCEALGTGVMSLILRKGGIHEGRSGFEFKHKDFFLFPTWFHTQGEKLTWQAPNPERFVFPPEDGRTSVDIDYFCMVEQVWRVTDWDKVAALAPHHVWAEDVIKERFVYDEESCLHVALVRTYKLAERWSFPYSKSHGGCRSWVNLPELAPGWTEALVPAVSDAEFEKTKAEVQLILNH